MNFKEVRLIGFKSFADKTSIKFEDGVTCIVGPNGCGKSNVADAVRWVLGEQSAKTLRGSNMKDVIFAGADTRRPLSFCEVTLVFNNEERIFDIDFEEVALTRRLYRSGESEYLINNQPCRMRDITNLLHGVGIGKEGYSIIGQGKVAQIMNSRPEDRRAIFEEATGVIRFKAEKGEIERKLESSRDNLTVYIQRMDEAENQLRPLEKQADTAKKFREYSSRLKYEEVNAYLVRSDTFEQETSNYREKIVAADKTLEEVERRLGSVDAEQTEIREKIVAADGKLRDVNENLRLYEVGLERRTGEANVVGVKIDEYRRRLGEANGLIESSTERAAQIDEQVARSTEKVEANDKRYIELEEQTREITRRLTDADTRLAAYERINNEKRASELSSVEDLADLRATQGSLNAKKDATEERIAEIKEAITKAEVRSAEFSRQLAETQEQKKTCEQFLNEKPAREEDLLAEINDLSRSEQKLTQDIADCNMSISNLTNNLNMYTDLKNRFSGYKDSVRRLQVEAQRNPELKKRIVGAIADIITTEKRYEVAIETAIGGAMQNLVVERAEDGRWLIQYLKRAGYGIATFLPVETMKGRPDTRESETALRENGALGLATKLVKYNSYYDGIIRYLLGNTLICDNIDSATKIATKYRNAFKIVTLDGDIVASSGAMTGGSRKAETGNLLSTERNIKECQENINRKRAALEKLKTALASASRELAEAREEYEKFRVKVQEETANFAALSQKEATLSELLADAHADAEGYQSLLERLTQTVSEIEGAVSSSAENEELLNRIRAEASQDAAARTRQIEQMRAARDELANKRQAIRVEAATVSSVRIAESENVARLKAEKGELLKTVEETRVTVRALESEIARLKAEAEKVSLTKEEQLIVSTLRAQLSELEEHKRALAERQDKLSEEHRDLYARQSEATEERLAAATAIARAETTLENMKLRLEEQYGLDYVSAHSLRDPDYDFAQSNANINSLKHKIAALGPVNQNAEEDYATLLARFNEMKTQKEDLDKGIIDLTNVLDELRANMQKQFDEGFQRINANFSQIFKELFGGGKAEMQLDYSDDVDPLEAGVEIVACPPGKKLTKISLLSGGEQAFTAIAILFAILKTHPMPFCILDEIEAALDEANVDRFARYLKKFSKETQFIVITHRKPTMTQADMLFGVTMEEKGVSKIVSVKLSEVETRLGGDTVM